MSVGTGFALVYGLYGAVEDPHKVSVPASAFYNAISRPLWGVCVAWVIVACSCGYGGAFAVLILN